MNYKIKTIDYFLPSHIDLYKNIAQLTQPTNKTYPQRDKWLFTKFFPGLKNGSRKMVVAFDEMANPVGVTLLKDTKEEKKICCFYVREDCRGNGIANKLMQQSLKALKTDTPLITVADSNISQLQRLLDKHNFAFSYKKKGVYRENDTENYFNNQATEKLKKDVLTPLFAYKLKQR